MEDAANKVPIPTVDGEDVGGRVTLRRRKAGRLGTAFLRAFRISPDLTVHLDPLGSEVWRLIDGRRTAAEILVALEQAHPEESGLAQRLGVYLSTLARNRLIRFE